MALVPTVFAETLGKVWTTTMSHTIKLGTRVAFGVEDPLKELSSDLVGDCIGDAVSHFTGVDALGWTASSIWAAGNEFFSPENADLSLQEKVVKAAFAGAENFAEDVIKDKLADAIEEDLIKNYYSKEYDEVLENYSYDVNYPKENSINENYMINKENSDNSYMYTNEALGEKYIELDKKIESERERELNGNYDRFEERREKILQNDIDEHNRISNKYDNLRQDLMDETQEKLNKELKTPENQERFAQIQKEHENNVADIKNRYAGNEEGFKQAMDEENASHLAKNKAVIDDTDAVKNYNNKSKEYDEAEKAEKEKATEKKNKDLEKNDEQRKNEDKATNEKCDNLKEVNGNAYKNAQEKNANNHSENCRKNDDAYSQASQPSQQSQNLSS